MLDDESDLTDLDDEFDPTSKKKASQTTGYRVRHALKAPRATTYTTQALYDQIHSADINLEPEYQRDVVWPEAKQSGLIDSIFRNFYVPPVIFTVSVDEEGSETRTCIDGKQRLTSIQRFMDGLISIKDPHTNDKYWYKDLGNMSTKKKTLSTKYQRLFANKQIVCVEYQDITDADEREVFQRVQLGMALTPAEKLQATKGPRAALVRKLQNDFLNDDALTGDALSVEMGRGADFRCLAQALYNIDIYPDSKNGGAIAQVDKWLSRPEAPTPEFTARVNDTFKVFVRLVRNNKLNNVFRTPARVAPIEFILIVVLIAVWKDKADDKQLAKAIGEMRANVREEHRDISLNTRVGSTLMDYIKHLKFGGTAEKRRRSPEPREAETEERTRRVKREPPPSPVVSAPVPTASSFSSRTASSSRAPPDRLASLRAVRAVPSAPRALRSPASATTPISPMYRDSNGDTAMSDSTSRYAYPQSQSHGYRGHEPEPNGYYHAPLPPSDSGWGERRR
ncbi:hypothetical protein PLICRDRAFT_173870 [Plicaturopsis crispa FD-325 SS-3]|nr:hypothetical protein PLICRDRAFT_173870 [Plicaturopsis crispa FD-325 SS-3]